MADPQSPNAFPAASDLFVSQRERLLEASAIGPAIDLASGRGRQAIACARLGIPTLAVDRSAEDLRTLVSQARAENLPVEALQADLETPHGIPLKSDTFGIALVFRFLYRPLMPEIERILRPGGILLYETFTSEQTSLGWGPRRGAFLLKPNELPGLFPGLTVELFDEGIREGERREASARLVARKAGA